MKRSSLIVPLFTTMCALAVYGYTLAPDLTWANFSSDGGELITAAVTLGVPHPPGYPTYVLWGKLFSWLPWGTAVYRLNFFSACCVAAAVGLVTAVNEQLLWAQENGQTRKNNRLVQVSAAAAGLTFAFAPLVWGQAVVSEVYALNLLCLALFLWALLTARPSWLVGLFLGLSITTHLTSLLMLPLAVVGCGWRQWRGLLVGLVAGLLPLLLLPLLAQSDSPVRWGEPDTLRGWWWLVSAQIYRPNLFAATPDLLVSRLAEWAILLPTQFFWLGLVVAAIGLAKFGSRTAGYWLPVTVLFTAVCYLLYAFVYNTPDAILYTLPVLLLLALFLGLGLRSLRWWGLLLPVCLLLFNFRAQDMRQAVMVRPSAEAVLTAAPPAALLVSSDSGTTFALWYFHHVEGRRPDIVVVDSNLFAFDWHRRHLAQQFPAMFVPDADDLSAFYATNEAVRPLCFARLAPDEKPDFSLDCGVNDVVK